MHAASSSLPSGSGTSKRRARRAERPGTSRDEMEPSQRSFVRQARRIDRSFEARRDPLVAHHDLELISLQNRSFREKVGAAERADRGAISGVDIRSDGAPVGARASLQGVVATAPEVQTMTPLTIVNTHRGRDRSRAGTADRRARSGCAGGATRRGSRRRPRCGRASGWRGAARACAPRASRGARRRGGRARRSSSGDRRTASRRRPGARPACRRCLTSRRSRAARARAGEGTSTWPTIFASARTPFTSR